MVKGRRSVQEVTTNRAKEIGARDVGEYIRAATVSHPCYGPRRARQAGVVYPVANFI